MKKPKDSIGCSTMLAEAWASDYWYTPEGITRRIEMLSEYFTYKIVNNSLLAYGETYGIKRFMWITAADEKVCPYCGKHDRKIYRVGQFLPPLPAHANCRCIWSLLT